MLGRPKLRPNRRFLGAVLRRTIWFTRQGFGCKCSLLIGAAQGQTVGVPMDGESSRYRLETKIATVLHGGQYERAYLGRRHFLKTLTAIRAAGFPIGSRLAFSLDRPGNRLTFLTIASRFRFSAFLKRANVSLMGERVAVVVLVRKRRGDIRLLVSVNSCLFRIRNLYDDIGLVS
jgi:hypothetical protein